MNWDWLTLLNQFDQQISSFALKESTKIEKKAKINSPKVVHWNKKFSMEKCYSFIAFGIEVTSSFKLWNQVDIQKILIALIMPSNEEHKSSWCIINHWTRIRNHILSLNRNILLWRKPSSNVCYGKLIVFNIPSKEEANVILKANESTFVDFCQQFYMWCSAWT